ncbi:MAG: phosphotyrosine protein phosphatase [Alphaproteobacteria bacterium]|nr:phosphotyrosine protein phosphatase [Alphaproteobacteria bacterium]
MTQKLLFICTQNRLRSPTAEQVFSTWDDIECDSAGLAPDAGVSLSTEQIDWADIIFVMEKVHRNKLSKKFRSHLKGKRVIVLGIPDDFEFMEEGLVRILKMKVPQFLR